MGSTLINASLIVFSIAVSGLNLGSILALIGFGYGCFTIRVLHCLSYGICWSTILICRSTMKIVERYEEREDGASLAR